jgi:cell division control protein 24
MEIAPGLPRTHTAPAMSTRTLQQQTTPSPLFQTQSHSSQYSSYSQTSALSGATLTSTSPHPDPRPTGTPTPQQSHAASPSNGGPITATNNIINQVADASKSLFQICISLRRRLRLVPGFEVHLDEVERQTADGTIDPVTAMWGCFRKGFPLMTVYNALGPAKPIQVDSKLPLAKQAKSAAFKFVQACMTELKFPSDECFQIRDLDGDDTAGFVKVSSNCWSDESHADVRTVGHQSGQSSLGHSSGTKPALCS